ncbi:MAG: FAD-dependent oxidoreductase, partial [Pseudomonadota bacterium]
HEMIIRTMTHHGIRFDPMPSLHHLTTETDFACLFPGSQGALYGQSPHGLTAAFKRPTARTPVKRLYLTGGGAHPGAGVPMAALSGKHAAGAILNDLTSTSMSARMAMHGGMSTG